MAPRREARSPARRSRVDFLEEEVEAAHRLLVCVKKDAVELDNKIKRVAQQTNWLFHATERNPRHASLRTLNDAFEWHIVQSSK